MQSLLKMQLLCPCSFDCAFKAPRFTEAAKGYVSGKIKTYRMHFNLLWLVNGQNCIGFSNTDINLCLVWFGFVFWGDLLRWREVQKKGLWSIHAVLPLELRNRFQSWLWCLSSQNIGGFCLAGNALPGCVVGVAHACVMTCHVVSCHAVSCCGTALGAAKGWEELLPWTAPTKTLVCYHCLVYKQNQSNAESWEEAIDSKHTAPKILA